MKLCANILFMTLLLLSYSGCNSTPVETKEIQFANIENLFEFRTSTHDKEIQAVLLVAGIPPEENYEILLAASKKSFLKRVSLEINTPIAEDEELLEKLAHFAAQEDAYGLAYGAALVYLIEGKNEVVGYVLPFDERDDVYQGKQWHSKELKDLVQKISQEYNLPL